IIGRLFQSIAQSDSRLGLWSMQEIENRYRKIIQNIPENIRAISKEYFRCFFLETWTKYNSKNIEELFLFIKTQYDGDLRDKLVTSNLLRRFSTLNEGEK